MSSMGMAKNRGRAEAAATTAAKNKKVTKIYKINSVFQTLLFVFFLPNNKNSKQSEVNENVPAWKPL